MDSVEEMKAEFVAPKHADDKSAVQAGCYLLELSLDWIVLRASENINKLLNISHVTLIDEPLGRFVQAQALHDLRNLFSRLSGTIGVARAYRVRLTHEQELVDVAFQLSDGRVLLEAIPCSDGHYGEAFGTVGGLTAGLAGAHGQAMLDAAARRMRALTGYDRVTLNCDGSRAESSRGSFAAISPDIALPMIVTDCDADRVPLFPRKSGDTSAAGALLAAPSAAALEQLHGGEIRATMTIPFSVDGIAGEFRCDSKRPRQPSFELHAAAELFAQLFALRLQVDRLRGV